jgi:hypothetical protein
MRTDLNFFPDDDATVCDSDLIGFNRPQDIVRDPMLTIARKRQLLAYWASDIHAVRGAPALRAYAFGPTVSIDEIKAALCQLDEMVDMPIAAAGSGAGASFSGAGA